MNIISFPIARRFPIAGTVKQPPRGVQHYLDLGFDDLQHQYLHKATVQSGLTVFLTDGKEIKDPINSSSEDDEVIGIIPTRGFRLVERAFNCRDVIGGFAIISFDTRGYQFVYVHARDGSKKALSLFHLDKQTGDPMRDFVLVTQIDGRHRLKFARPSNWSGQTTTISILISPFA